MGGTISEDEKLITGLANLSSEVDRIHVDVNMVDGVELNMAEFRKWKNGEYASAQFILEDGKYICGVETEKMSKSKYNTVNPDVLVEKFGADTFRMYEMFLGPVEQSKPWDSKGIEGVHRFLRKLWRLFYDDLKGKVWTEDKPTDAEMKVLHRTIKKIEEDTERFSFNTAVSTFMICVNELAEMKCHKKEVLEPLLFLLSPYAPHISEELCSLLGSTVSPALGGLEGAVYPVFNPALLVESSKEYPVSINGKVRTNIVIALDATQAVVEEIILQNEVIQKWLEGNAPKKIIYVKNKMVNVVI
jgi:leucyl-tRNA synthetase